MDATPPSHPPVTPPSGFLAAWPRSAQLTTAFLLGVCATLLIVHVGSSLRWASRPSELERGAVYAYRVDLNRASRAELLQLPGVGPNLAERIEGRRPFQSVDQVVEVPGIGPATLERLRPFVRVQDEPTAESTKPAPSTGKAKSKKATPGEPIDINRAAATELQRLPGIGPKRAQAIIDERNKRPFQSVDELRRVRGIGAKTLESLRPFVTVGNSTARMSSAEQNAKN